MTGFSKYITNYKWPTKNDKCAEKNIFIHLHYTVDTFSESKVALVSMRYFQWCTIDFKYGVL